MNEDADRIEGLERLARTRKPERDLWPGIHARLKPRRSRYPLAQFALAASLVAGLAVVMTLGLRGTTGEPAGAKIAAAAPLADDSSRAIVQANLSIVEQAERQLELALEQNPESASLRSLLQSAETRQRVLRAML
jgi:hypothetical protein